METFFPCDIIRSLNIKSMLQIKPVLLKLNPVESLAFLEAEKEMIEAKNLEIIYSRFGDTRYFYKQMRIILDKTLIKEI